MDINYIINSVTKLNIKKSTCNKQITPELQEIFTSSEFIPVGKYPRINRLLDYLSLKYSTKEYYYFSLYSGFTSFVSKRAISIIDDIPYIKYSILKQTIENIMDKVVGQYFDLLKCYNNHDDYQEKRTLQKNQQYQNEEKYQDMLKEAYVSNINRKF